MPRGRKYLLMASVLVLVGLGFFVFPSREPEYGGKKLSEWVERVYSLDPPPHRSAETDEAIRHLGTNAIPFLLKWVRYEPGPVKVRFYALANVLLQAMNQKWTLWDHREVRADNALVAMRALGWKMATADIVELSGAIKDPNAYRSALRAADFLMSFGQFSSLAPGLLAPGLTNRHEEVRENVASRIALMGTNAAFAVPDLLRLLHDPSVGVRKEATNALQAIDPHALERGTQ